MEINGREKLSFSVEMPFIKGLYNLSLKQLFLIEASKKKSYQNEWVKRDENPLNSIFLKITRAKPSLSFFPVLKSRAAFLVYLRF